MPQDIFGGTPENPVPLRTTFLPDGQSVEHRASDHVEVDITSGTAVVLPRPDDTELEFLSEARGPVWNRSDKIIVSAEMGTPFRVNP